MMVHLLKHKPYNVLHCVHIEALCSVGARLILLMVGHQGCEGVHGESGSSRPLGLGVSSSQRDQGAEPLIGGSGVRTFAMAGPRYENLYSP